MNGHGFILRKNLAINMRQHNIRLLMNDFRLPAFRFPSLKRKPLTRCPKFLLNGVPLRKSPLMLTWSFIQCMTEAGMKVFPIFFIFPYIMCKYSITNNFNNIFLQAPKMLKNLLKTSKGISSKEQMINYESYENYENRHVAINHMNYLNKNMNHYL